MRYWLLASLLAMTILLSLSACTNSSTLVVNSATWERDQTHENKDLIVGTVTNKSDQTIWNPSGMAEYFLKGELVDGTGAIGFYYKWPTDYNREDFVYNIKPGEMVYFTVFPFLGKLTSSGLYGKDWTTCEIRFTFEGKSTPIWTFGE